MPRDGRIPTPTALKVLAGNPGHRPLNKREPKPRPIAPACPKWLDPVAKREWKRVAPELERLGLLTMIDLAALAGYCQSYAEWQTHTETIRKEGSTFKTDSGQIKARPEVAMAKRALADVRAFAVEFGLTPSARARLQLVDSGYPDDDEDSPFDI